MENLTLGLRIKAAIKRSGFSQKSLCNKIGISEVTMVSYTKGRRTPPVSTIIAIATITEANLDWLLTGKNKTDSNNPEYSSKSSDTPFQNEPIDINQLSRSHKFNIARAIAGISLRDYSKTLDIESSSVHQCLCYRWKNPKVNQAIDTFITDQFRRLGIVL